MDANGNICTFPSDSPPYPSLFNPDPLPVAPLLPILPLRQQDYGRTRAFSLRSFIFAGFAKVQIMVLDYADSHLGEPLQPPDPSPNFAPTWNPDAYPLLNLPYEGYNGSQITDNGPGQPVLPWQQLPGDELGVDTTSFTALLNSPFDSFTTNPTPMAVTPIAETPVAQTAVQNFGHVQAPQQYAIATGYRPQTTHVMIRPKPTPVIPEDDSGDHDDEPIPKRKRVQREGPRRLPPFLREMQADARKRQAEFAAAQARAANPQNSTVDLTNGMDRLLRCLEFLSLLLTFQTLQLSTMLLRLRQLIPKKKKFAMA